MKFQVRDGYVVRLINVVKIDDNKTETQEINYYGGQTCDLSAAEADLHTHKLEPKDKAAGDYLAAKVAQVLAPVGGPAPLDVAAIIAAAVQAGMAAAMAAAGVPAEVTAAVGGKTPQAAKT